MRLRWTNPALRDLEAIIDNVAKANPKAATVLLSHILNSVDALTTHPHLGRQGRVVGTRELVISNTPFIVPYRVDKTEVVVLTVFHGARRWPETFS